MEREMDSFIDKQTELRKIKRCMRLRKIGMCEVMKDNSMEDGFQHRDDQFTLKEKCGERIHVAN
jgi:hypothetical protein